MLKRIKVQGYKSLRNVDVKLQPLTVLFGPNSAGKSNFLDALQLISRIGTSRNLKEAFDPPYRGKPLESFSFNKSGLSGLRRQKQVKFAMEIDLELSDSVVDSVNEEVSQLSNTGNGRLKRKTKKIAEKNIRYRVEIGMQPSDGSLYVSDEYLTALSRDGEEKSSRKAFIERQNDRITLRMEGQAHPRYYELGLDHTILSTPLYTPHYPHLTAFRRELESWRFFYFEPRERMREATSVKEVRNIGLMGEELGAFLNTLKRDKSKSKDFEGLVKSMNVLIPSINDIDVEVNRFGEIELSLLEGGIKMPARLLSEGTLRLLGLLALTKGNFPSLIGFEEPENGVHPKRIRHIAEILSTQQTIGNNQFIVTTHSPNLLNIIDPSNLLVVGRENGSTKISKYDEWGPLVRRRTIDKNLNKDDFLPVSDRINRGDFDA